MFWKAAIKCTETARAGGLDVWLKVHRDPLDGGHFTKIQRVAALGSSKCQERTAKGLIMIHSTRTERWTSSSSLEVPCKDARAQWHWKLDVLAK